MHATPIDYQAVPVQLWNSAYDTKYIQSVNDGISELRSQIDHYISLPCGKRTYISLAGYSQGAEGVFYTGGGPCPHTVSAYGGWSPRPESARPSRSTTG